MSNTDDNLPPSDLLQTIGMSADSPAPPPTSHTTEHEQIGPYHILENIGEGGMGTIYKAEQLQPVRRIVALKVIKLGMDTREVVARFEAERQSLAMLSHPNVARVFEAGMTPAGRSSRWKDARHRRRQWPAAGSEP